jgi:ketosteroid isomerase-like protein
MQSLVERVNVLENEREILRSLFQYGHALDSGREDEFLDCFTPTGAWISLGAKRRFRGQSALRQFFANHTHAPQYHHQHLVINPLTAIDGDEARVRSYYVRLDEHPDGPYVRSFGRYSDRFVRCPDGRWRIDERVVDGDAAATRDFPPRPAWISDPTVGDPL